jgi:hypothetical protein
MVVGIRQTRRATRTVIVTGTPAPAVSTLYTENAQRDPQTTMKTAERPMRRIFRAASFGVLCRFAP